MEMQFRHLERAIESQPMPPQFQDTKALVYCNDCSAKTTVKYHWLGLKCAMLVTPLSVFQDNPMLMHSDVTPTTQLRSES